MTLEDEAQWIAPRRPDGTLLYPSQEAYEGRRVLETASRREWEARLREWLSMALLCASAGDPHYGPPAPDGIAEDWRWANWIAYSDEDLHCVALVRMYGCRCTRPLIGYNTHTKRIAHLQTPRCRTCGADADDQCYQICCEGLGSRTAFERFARWAR